MKILGSLLSLSILLSCQPVLAQPRPVISTKYTDTEIEKMMTVYRVTHSSDTTPADAIRNKFSSDFPGASDIEWKTALDIYEVDFEIDRVDYEAYYDKDGNLFMYSFDVRERDLPAIVKNTAIAEYPDYIFDDMKEIRKGTAILYKIDLERNKSEVTLFIKNNGAILKAKND